jgi:hypothetical protein
MTAEGGCPTFNTKLMTLFGASLTTPPECLTEGRRRSSVALSAKGIYVCKAYADGGRPKRPTEGLPLGAALPIIYQRRVRRRPLIRSPIRST